MCNAWSRLPDLAFADLVLWCPTADEQIYRAIAQVRPNTGPTALEDDVVGTEIKYEPDQLVAQAFASGVISHTDEHRIHAGVPVDVTAIPVMDGHRCLAVVEMHSNRVGLRSPGALEDAYLEAAELLVGMMQRRQFPLPGDRRVPWVSPRVGDGMMRVDRSGVIRYASPNAVSA